MRTLGVDDEDERDDVKEDGEGDEDEDEEDTGYENFSRSLGEEKGVGVRYAYDYEAADAVRAAGDADATKYASE